MAAIKPGFWLIGLIYPFIIFFLIDRVPPFVLVLLPIVLFVGHLSVHSGLRSKYRIGIVSGGVILLIVIWALLDAMAVAKSYPIMISLGLAAVFGYSLVYPPSLVEKIARITEPNLNRVGQLYTRRVTIIWFLFLLLNGFISFVTAAYFSDAVWLLYNGFVSYLLIGLLFGSEWIVRQFVKTKHVDA